MILIITNTQDLTSDLVVKEISRRSLPFTRLNTDEFPTNILGTVEFGGTKSTSVLEFTNRDKIVDLHDIKSVLYRRPVPPVPCSDISAECYRKFCIDECYDFLRGAWFSLDCKWISHPEAIRISEHKIYQLKIASESGFIIPSTIISNNAKNVIEFYHKNFKKIVVKPIYMGFIDEKDPKIIYTTEVNDDDIEEMKKTLHFSPSIFQQRVQKIADIRVTIVGEKIFSAKIEAKNNPDEIPDWRYASNDNLVHSSHVLPPTIEAACLKLVSSLNLKFGAIDLGLDENGRYIFFEINPNGQWAWLETILGLPICSAIVDLLSVD